MVQIPQLGSHTVSVSVGHDSIKYTTHTTNLCVLKHQGLLLAHVPYPSQRGGAMFIMEPCLSWGHVHHGPSSSWAMFIVGQVHHGPCSPWAIFIMATRAQADEASSSITSATSTVGKGVWQLPRVPHGFHPALTEAASAHISLAKQLM